MAPFDADAWLGAVFGEGMGCKLQDRQQRFLKKAFADGDWDESDVPPAASPQCRSAMRGCGWMCSMRPRSPRARRSRKQTARVSCGGWHQGRRRTPAHWPRLMSSGSGPDQSAAASAGAPRASCWGGAGGDGGAGELHHPASSTMAACHANSLGSSANSTAGSSRAGCQPAFAVHVCVRNELSGQTSLCCRARRVFRGSSSEFLRGLFIRS